MDTSDLKGAHLDYWVACAERQTGYVDAGAIPVPPPFPSDSVLGEAIIEREQIVLFLVVDAELGNQFLAGVGPTEKYGLPMNDEGVWMGDSRLEAGMRCYVARTFANAADADTSVAVEINSTLAQKHNFP
jgi:hypothetical protein